MEKGRLTKRIYRAEWDGVGATRKRRNGIKGLVEQMCLNFEELARDSLDELKMNVRWWVCVCVNAQIKWEN